MLWIRRSLQRPSSRRVAERAVILKCVAGYAAIVPPSDFFDTVSGNESSSDMHEMLAAAARAQLLGKLGDLQKKLTPWERKLFYGRALSHRQRVDARWRVEAFQVLLWALHIVPSLPPFDTMADADIPKSFWPPDIRTFLSTATLRPKDTINKARIEAELWHRRSRPRPDAWSMVGSIARERHFALNWLCGYAPGNQWDKTPTDI